MYFCMQSGVRALMLKIFDTRDSETIWVAQNTNDDGDYNWFDSSVSTFFRMKLIPVCCYFIIIIVYVLVSSID